MKKRPKGDCTNCGWGVAWDREGLIGRCKWTCPIPHPRHWRGFAFGPNAKPISDCPAWKRARKTLGIQLGRRWREPLDEYLKRLDSEREKLLSELDKNGLDHAGS